MLSWLNQTGKEFKIPREDRTPMYLGGLGSLSDFDASKAFNASAAAKGQEGSVDPKEKDNDSNVEGEAEAEDFDPSREERKTAEGLGGAADGRLDKAREEKRKIGIKELTPFPLNNAFSSQPVLSEQFRETIYTKAVEDKMSVRSISAESGVTMERVAAVIRMKQMERDWVKQVSHHQCLSLQPDMMIPFQNSISL